MNRLETQSQTVFFCEKMRLAVAAAVLDVISGCGGVQLTGEERLCHDKIVAMRNVVADFWRYTNKYPAGSEMSDKMSSLWGEDVFKTAGEVATYCHEPAGKNPKLLRVVKEGVEGVDKVRIAFDAAGARLDLRRRAAAAEGN